MGNQWDVLPRPRAVKKCAPRPRGVEDVNPPDKTGPDWDNPLLNSTPNTENVPTTTTSVPPQDVVSGYIKKRNSALNYE
jgi:hypothetical protein